MGAKVEIGLLGSRRMRPSHVKAGTVETPKRAICTHMRRKYLTELFFEEWCRWLGLCIHQRWNWMQIDLTVQLDIRSNLIMQRVKLLKGLQWSDGQLRFCGQEDLMNVIEVFEAMIQMKNLQRKLTSCTCSALSEEILNHSWVAQLQELWESRLRDDLAHAWKHRMAWQLLSHSRGSGAYFRWIRVPLACR